MAAFASLEELCILYVEQGLTLAQIAARYGVTLQAVAYHLRKGGIPRRANLPAAVTLEELRVAYQSGQSLREVAARFGISNTLVRKKLRDAGIPRRSNDGNRGKPRPTLQQIGNPNWKGGRITTPDGYVKILIEGSNARGAARYEFEHRLIAERMIGRALRDGEVVHHINGHTADNCPDNLVVMTRSQHRHHHSAHLEDETRTKLSDAARRSWAERRRQSNSGK